MLFILSLMVVFLSILFPAFFFSIICILGDVTVISQVKSRNCISMWQNAHVILFTGMYKSGFFGFVSMVFVR